MQEAADIGERAAQELLGTMEPRTPGYMVHLNAAAQQGSVKAMRALAKNAEPSRAIDLLIRACGEEIPGSLVTRTLVRLARALKEEGNPTTALAILNDEVRRRFLLSSPPPPPP